MPPPLYKAVWQFDRKRSLRVEYTDEMYAFRDTVWQWTKDNGCEDHLCAVYVNFGFDAVSATFTDKGSAVRAKLSLTAQEGQKIDHR